MTPEKRGDLGENRSLSPLNPDNSQEIISLVFNPEAVTLTAPNMERFKRENKNLLEYTDDMGLLRQSTHLKTAKDLSLYDSGGLFMYESIRNQYLSNQKTTHHISQDIIDTSFQDLIDVENNHYKLDKIKKVCLGSTDREPLTPLLLNDSYTFSAEYLTEIKDELAFVIAKMHDKSKELAKKMLDQESQLFDFLYQNLETGFFNKSDIRERFAEFVYGALDVYYPFRIHEEISSLSRKIDHVNS